MASRHALPRATARAVRQARRRPQIMVLCITHRVKDGNQAWLGQGLNV